MLNYNIFQIEVGIMYQIGKWFRRKCRWKFISMAFLICLSLSILCFQYYNHLQKIIFEESSEYLEEISKQIGLNVKNKIEDYYAFLDLISNFMTTQNAGTINDLQSLINMHKEYLDFQHLILIDSNNIGHRINGQTITFSEDMYLRETILNKEQSLSTLHTIDNKKSVILAVPVENVMLDGKNIVAIAVGVETEAFEQVLSMTYFDEKAYSFILNKEDDLIIGAASSTSLNMGYNLLNTLQDSFIGDIEHHQSAQMELTLDGTPLVMAYTPIENQDLYLLTFAPVSEVHKKSDHLLKMTFLPFSGILLISFILACILILFYQRHRLKLENIAFVDPITGGNTLQGFYKRAKETLTLSNRKQYALVYTNIKNFKVLNEQLGHNNCDGILKAFYESISANLADKEIVGRVTADNFCVLLEYQNNQNLRTRFEDWYAHTRQNVEKLKYAQWVHPEMEFGIYVIENNTLPFQQMITRAKLALREVEPNSTKLQYALYDDKLRRQLLREKQIEDMMEDALKNGEFQVYLQPKYSLPDERIVGAEALTRWNSESEGMIYPDEFIPLFEKNGFIIQLDLWIFEEVCRLIRTWLDEGIKPIKISINCSRVHFKKKDFFKEYSKIARFYNVPEHLLELELTEGLVLEDIQQFIQVIKEIRKAGFGCSVDDFGSGYSSLSIIENFPVDTLKLDQTFFRHSTQDNKRTEAVVSSIISMAKSLSMKIVAEGVEEREQVDLLKRLGCDFIQGYVFAKPMPVKDFKCFFKRNKSE